MLWVGKDLKGSNTFPWTSVPIISSHTLCVITQIPKINNGNCSEVTKNQINLKEERGRTEELGSRNPVTEIFGNAGEVQSSPPMNNLS